MRRARADATHLLVEHLRFCCAQAAAAVLLRPGRNGPAAFGHRVHPGFAVGFGREELPAASTPVRAGGQVDRAAHRGRAVRFEERARFGAEGFEVVRHAVAQSSRPACQLLTSKIAATSTGHAEREFVAADGEARVATGVAERVDHQVGRRVDHGGLLVEARRRAHEALELYAPPHAVEVAVAGGAHLREYAERARARSGLAGLDIEVGADGSLVGESGRPRTAPGPRRTRGCPCVRTGRSSRRAQVRREA